jgi:micrococcal nuclease
VTYEYMAEVVRVIDGDTVDVDLDLGLEIYRRTRLRLASVNAPELHDPSQEVRKKAILAKAWLVSRLPVGSEVTVRTFKDRQEKYGRYLAEVLVPSETTSVNQQMVTLGLAVPFMVVTSPAAPEVAP